MSEKCPNDRAREDGEPEGDAPEADALKAALAAQVRMLWELDLGDLPMALRFEPSFRRE